MHYDPKIGKLKMGPIWDLDLAWNNGFVGATPGFLPKTAFWLKELIGWEITAAGSGVSLGTGIARPEYKDDHYISFLKNRWAAVRSQFNTELDSYIDSMNNRFSRVTGFSQSGVFAINGNRTGLKTIITNIRNNLDTISNAY